MSTNIIPFSYADHPVRVIQINGEPWFVPSDVCAILGHRNASQAVAQHVHADDSMRATLTIREGSRDVTRERTLVNESGLYALIFGSSLGYAFRGHEPRRRAPSGPRSSHIAARVIDLRMSKAAGEIQWLKEYDYYVINDDFEEAVTKTKEIISAAHQKVDARIDTVVERYKEDN